MRKKVLLVYVVTLSIVVVCVTVSPNPCHVIYKTINEKVPYCGVSLWVEWDCRNTCTGLSTQMNYITHVRAMCCGSSDCIEECHFPKGYGEETNYCGIVCPPYFTSSPPSTASTGGTISTTQMSSNSTKKASTRVSSTQTIRDTTTKQYETNMLNSASFGLFPSSTNVKTTNSPNVNMLRSATPGSFPSTTNVKATWMSALRADTTKTQSGSTSQHIFRETQHYEGSTPNTGHQSSITFAANDSCGFGYWTSITVKPSGLMSVCTLLTLLTVLLVVLCIGLLISVAVIIVQKKNAAIRPTEDLW